MTKVCPECGGHYFRQRQSVKLEFTVDGEGNVLDNNSNHTILFKMPADPKLTCATCKFEMESSASLVTEEYFHTVICADDDEKSDDDDEDNHHDDE